MIISVASRATVAASHGTSCTARPQTQPHKKMCLYLSCMIFANHKAVISSFFFFTLSSEAELKDEVLDSPVYSVGLGPVQTILSYLPIYKIQLGQVDTHHTTKNDIGFLQIMAPKFCSGHFNDNNSYPFMLKQFESLAQTQV